METQPPLTISTADLTNMLKVDEFPRSAGYDPMWVIRNGMGPNVLWLIEYLSEAIALRPGMRVLDMGCGKGISSIFLAKEFDVEVWATDLWISAKDNWERVCEAQVEDRVHPIHAEAHALPFADDFFDAALSVDAYHYFGTDDLYLGYYSRFVKPDAQIGIVVPGVKEEFGARIPEHLIPYWHWDFCSFHSPDWWHAHWEKTGLVDVTSTDWMPHGSELWAKWLDVCERAGGRTSPEEADMLRVDAGRYLGFDRIIARRLEKSHWLV
ncbi:MAG: cyclopropane-fatty-acyl-phospholipid synthase family protein [Chloroflexota bacterium]